MSFTMGKEGAQSTDARPKSKEIGFGVVVLPRTGPSKGTRLRRKLVMWLGDPTLGELMHPSWRPWFLRFPSIPLARTRRYRPAAGAWPEPSRETPPQLRTVPGIARDVEAENRAYREAPLRGFVGQHRVAAGWLWRRGWRPALPMLGEFYRADIETRLTAKAMPTVTPRLSGAELTQAIREKAASLGLSAVGFAAYDERYTFVEQREGVLTGSVVVCVLEQNFEAVQTTPSIRAERSALSCLIGLMQRDTALAQFIHEQGYRAEAAENRGMVIHYAVQAGLGQLGLNGQLLTPQAGSRVKLALVYTDAELVHDEPVDYGIETICDACKICVRRCPVGAIPLARQVHRGVTKIKLKTERCMPIVAQTEGCSVCMKVCPVQRYGLDAVKRTYLETGEILGKGTDELEGYHWPIDGKYYDANEKPKIDSADLLSPPGWQF